MLNSDCEHFVYHFDHQGCTMKIFILTLPLVCDSYCQLVDMK